MKNIADHTAYSMYCIVQPKQGQLSHSHPSFNIKALHHIRKRQRKFYIQVPRTNVFIRSVPKESGPSLLQNLNTQKVQISA